MRCASIATDFLILSNSGFQYDSGKRLCSTWDLSGFSPKLDIGILAMWGEGLFFKWHKKHGLILVEWNKYEYVKDVIFSVI